MKLLKLSLENFQGIKKLELDFSGKDASIYGDNETGKTTVFNAFTWLLFDKASTNAKNFTPKTKNKSGKGVHHLDHTVEAVFERGNGERMTLKKVYAEDWVTKRGSADKELKGHTTSYYVDEVPYPKNQFESYIQQFIGDGVIPRLLTQPDFFPSELSWQDRREILLDICGDITDDEVLAQTKALADLRGYLLKAGTADQYHTVDDFLTIAKAQKKKFTEDMEEIDARIKEVEYLTPDVQGLNAKDLEAELRELEFKKQSKLNLKNGEINGNPELNDCKRQLLTLMADETRARQEHYEKTSANRNQQLEAKLDDLRKERAALEEKSQRDHSTLSQINDQIEICVSRRNYLIGEYNRVFGECWDDSQAICPTCKRQLEEEKIEALKAEFNLNKSKRLEDINHNGKLYSKEKIAELEARAKELERALVEQRRAYEGISGEINLWLSEKQEPIKFEETEEYLAINNKIIEITAKADALESDLIKGSAAITEDIEAIEAEIYAIQEAKTNLKQAAEFKKRIKDLEADEKSISRKLSHIEKGIHLCEVFTREKVKLLDNKINSKFKRVRFQLFKEQVNGGLQDACEVLVPTKDGKLVPYSTDANNAAKINAGLEIIDVLNKHYDIHLPVFVDNAESVTKLLEIDTQVIKLVVSEQDKKLRMEVKQ